MHANLSIVPVSRGQEEAQGQLVGKTGLLRELDLAVLESSLDSHSLRMRLNLHLEIMHTSYIPSVCMYGDDVRIYAYGIHLRVQVSKSNKLTPNIAFYHTTILIHSLYI